VYRPFSPSLKPDPIDLDVSGGWTFRISRVSGLVIISRYHPPMETAISERKRGREIKIGGKRKRYVLMNGYRKTFIGRSGIWKKDRSANKQYVKYILPRGSEIAFPRCRYIFASWSSSAIFVNPGRKCSTAVELLFFGNTEEKHWPRSKGNYILKKSLVTAIKCILFSVRILLQHLPDLPSKYYQIS